MRKTWVTGRERPQVPRKSRLAGSSNNSAALLTYATILERFSADNCRFSSQCTQHILIASINSRSATILRIGGISFRLRASEKHNTHYHQASRPTQHLKQPDRKKHQSASPALVPDFPCVPLSDLCHAYLSHKVDGGRSFFLSEWTIEVD